MSVRRREWRDPETGAQKEAWMIDVTYQPPGGAKRRVREVSPINTRRGATEFERHVLQALADGTYDRNEATVPTLAEFAPRFVEGYAKANRQKHSSIVSKDSAFTNHLLPRLGSRRLNDISAEDIQQLKTGLADRSPKTVNNVLSVLGKCLHVAVEWGVIEQVPTRVRLLKVQQAGFTFYDYEEYAKLVTAAEQIDPRVLAFVLLGGDAGLRDGEIIALEWGDLDFKNGFIHVQRAEWRLVVGAPKGGRGRRIRMTRKLAQVLQDLRHLRGPRVFYRDGEQEKPVPVSPETTRNWMRAAQRLCGLPVTGKKHTLRHTFCSHLAMRGAPAKAIQELAGHVNLSTTQRYMHLSPAEKDRAITLLDEARSVIEPRHGTSTAQEKRGHS